MGLCLFGNIFCSPLIAFFKGPGFLFHVSVAFSPLSCVFSLSLLSVWATSPHPACWPTAQAPRWDPCPSVTPPPLDPSGPRGGHRERPLAGASWGFGGSFRKIWFFSLALHLSFIHGRCWGQFPLEFPGSVPTFPGIQCLALGCVWNPPFVLTFPCSVCEAGPSVLGAPGSCRV